MFAIGGFGELAFAEPLTAQGGLPFGGGPGRGIGGSGFPEDWFARMAAGMDDERRRREREAREVTELIELGLL